MSTVTRLTAFAAAAAVVFGLALLLGRAIGPVDTGTTVPGPGVVSPTVLPSVEEEESGAHTH